MTRIIRHPPTQQPNEGGGNPYLDEERPVHSAAARVTSGDPTAGSTNRPGADVKGPAEPRLPSVDDFDFLAACAKDIARKFPPRLQYRGRDQAPRYFADEGSENEGKTKWWDAPRRVPPPGGGGRGFIRGFCTTLLIVVGTPAAFGLVQPLNDLLPDPMGDMLSNVSHELGGSLVDRALALADFEMPEGSVNSEGILTPVEPVRAGLAKSVSKVPTTAQLAAAGVGSGGPATEIATAAAATAVEARPVQADEERPQMVALQAPVEPEPQQPSKPAGPTGVDEPASGATKPVLSALSPAQIEHLLARGEEFLQAGDIASARLAFERVAASGDQRGAKGVGMTYDPRVYARLRVTGLTPDREQAEFWYRKAGEKPTLDKGRFAIADASRAEQSVAQGAGSPEWIAACARKYKSFEPTTGLYTARSGVKRPCLLP